MVALGSMDESSEELEEIAGECEEQEEAVVGILVWLVRVIGGIFSK